jgi:hypothetical protein
VSGRNARLTKAIKMTTDELVIWALTLAISESLNNGDTEGVKKMSDAISLIITQSVSFND